MYCEHPLNLLIDSNLSIVNLVVFDLIKTTQISSCMIVWLAVYSFDYQETCNSAFSFSPSYSLDTMIMQIIGLDIHA